MIKTKISKRVSTLVRKMFSKNNRALKKEEEEEEVRRRVSLPPLTPRERTMLSDAALWRQNVELLCREFDDKKPLKSLKAVRFHDDTSENIRLQTRVYRDQLDDLKIEARQLKVHRDGLYHEMQQIRDRHMQENFQRRRSEGVFLRARA